MNKDRFFYFNAEDSEIDLNIDLSILSEEESEFFESFVEKTRFFIELSSLYKVFDANFKLLLESFIINTDDSIEYKNGDISEDDLYILINTLTINLIASSKTLIEAIDVYLKAILSIQSFDDFREKTSSLIYDKSFAYRFVYQLRNFSQHGHLPVDINKKRASFNLDNILNKPHFTHNKKLKNEMMKHREDIISTFGHNPHISYVYTIADFTYYTIKIYYEFLNYIKDDLKNTQKEVRLKVSKYSTLIVDKMFYYSFDDNEVLHCFNTNDNTMSLFAEIKNIVKKSLNKEEQELNRIKKDLKDTGISMSTK